MNSIPNLMTMLSGIEVKDKETWGRYRREEILMLLREYAFGIRDIERPEGLRFELINEKIEYGMRVKELEGGFDSYSFPFRLYLPEKSNGKIPVIVYVAHENMERSFEFDEVGNMRSEKTESDLPLKYITDRGYGVAFMPAHGITPDWHFKTNFTQGVFSVVKSPGGRKDNSWATLSAWAWGVSRVVDYLETDEDVDEKRIAVTGHSRSGKAALWAGAEDKRILLTIPNNTGCMGAALLRGKRGEHLKDINISDWFCDNCRKYNDCEELYPIDMHMLLASVAPRYLYITGSEEDEWADPNAEFRAARSASAAYELYGVKGLCAPEGGAVTGEVYNEGRIAFHVKPGDHSMTMFDWENILDYFDKIGNA